MSRASSREIATAFAGTWRITETELWDSDALDMVQPGFIRLERNRHGRIEMIAVRVFLDCRYGERDGRPLVELSFEGTDDRDQHRDRVRANNALAAKDPDVFRADLADSLNNLSYTLAEMWQAEPALAAGREAVDLYRTVAAKRPDALQPDLAGALENLSSRLFEMGQREATLAAIREAIDIFRGLTARHAGAFQRDLERTLHCLELRSRPGVLQDRGSIRKGFDDLPLGIAALAAEDVDHE